jgi:hypothetical protein
VKFLTNNILDFYKLNEFSDAYLTKYFTNTKVLGSLSPNINNPYPLEWNNKDSFVGTIDGDNTYEINSFGFRGKIYDNSETIASGCSMTFGTGLPEEGRWSNLLSNKINKNIINLGNPGASVETICNTVIQYCLNNKMPKEIFCLMPDFFRRLVVVDKEFYKSKTGRGHLKEENGLDLLFCNPTIIRHDDLLFMEVQDSKYIEDSTSPHQLILDSINYIYILEAFCLSNNIKLYWTTWDLSSSLIMEELCKIKDFKLKKFKSFFQTYTRQNEDHLIQDSCNLYHESEFKDSLWWRMGSDYAVVNSKKIYNRKHPGVHFQIHVSDFFHTMHNEDNEDN